MTRVAVGDSVLRIVLVTMSLDPASPMTAAQRQWTREALAQRVTPFTAEELARLKAPVLAYAQTRMPTSYEVIAAQFRDGHRVTGTKGTP